jgi:uncharacterized protein YyaL (SSP411 family)
MKSLRSAEAFSKNESMSKSIITAQINRTFHKSCKNNEIIENAILSLYRYVKENGWEGYDPYDGLNSRLTSYVSGRSKWLRILFVQLNKSLPINIRSILRIKKGIHIKGMGLFALAFLKLYETTGDPDFLKEAMFCLDFLKTKSLKEHYMGHCWGDYFEYQPAKSALTSNTTNTPDIINTVVCALAFLEHYDITGNEESLAIAMSSRNFIIHTLYINNGGKAFFKYTPISKSSGITYNASTHGAMLLAKISKYKEDTQNREIAQRVIDYVIAKQKPNGAWYYSESDGKEKIQIDFHQGFILDDLYDFIRYTKPSDDQYIKALLKGAEFYRNEQFLLDGKAKWRWPRQYPVDIHNQAQGIITFSRLGELESEYLDFAKKIAFWTIKNMQGRDGEFYYQNWRYFTNKITYMRWAQAWMMLALSTLLESTKSCNSVLTQI